MTEHKSIPAKEAFHANASLARMGHDKSDDYWRALAINFRTRYALELISERRKKGKGRDQRKSNIAVGYEKTCSARNTIFKAALNNYHFERSEKSMV